MLPSRYQRVHGTRWRYNCW
uniref:Uncharacterized protein n=1 Tax=Arundo donax TaxID=35708 RepID=A0A0A8XP19_ARUDO